MTPRAPVAVRCVRKGKQFGFVTLPRVRRNPATPAQLLDLYDATQRIFGRKYSNFSNKDDIIATAGLAVVEAAKTYDPSKGDWKPYALKIAEFAVASMMRDEGGGRERAGKRTELAKLKKAYMLEHAQREPTSAQLAEFSGRSLKDIFDLQRDAASGATVSSSQSLVGGDSDEGDTKLEDTLSASTADQVEAGQAASIDVRKQREKVRELSRMEQMFDAYLQKGKSITWIAKKMGMGETKAREIAKGLRAQLAPPAED